MKNCVIIHVIETDFQGRRVQLGASLNKEAAERKCEELKASNRYQHFEVNEYAITEEYEYFDWI
jgi:hypothetical protein